MRRTLLALIACAVVLLPAALGESAGGEWSALASFSGNNARVKFASVADNAVETCRVESFRDGWLAVASLDKDLNVKRLRVPIWKVRSIVLEKAPPTRALLVARYGQVVSVYVRKVFPLPVSDHVDYFEAVTLFLARAGSSSMLAAVMETMLMGGMGGRAARAGEPGRQTRMLSQVLFSRRYFFFLMFAFESPGFEAAERLLAQMRDSKEGKALAELKREMESRSEEIRRMAAEVREIDPRFADMVERLGSKISNDPARFLTGPSGRRPGRPRNTRRTPNGRIQRP